MGKFNHKQFQDIYESLALSLYCAAIEWFLYGINLVLFYFSLKTLRKCRVPNKRALSIAISAIFFFCTIHWTLQLVNAGKLLSVQLLPWAGQDAHKQHQVSKQWNQINIVMGVMYVLSNITADGIFIYRCYCVWGFRKRIIAVPIVLLVVTGVLGFLSVISCGIEDFAEFLFLNWFFPLEVLFTALTNSLLMALTAGRIWWIARGARALMGPEVVKQYRTVIAMILESGALYVTPAVLYLILFKTETASTQVIFAALSQIVGIAPTIIVVRVGLGNSINGVESFQVGSVRSPLVIDIRPEEEEYAEDLDSKEQIV